MSNLLTYSIIDTLLAFDISLNDELFSQASAYKTQLSNITSKSNNLVNDSRDINKGDVFCAVFGSNQSGNQYIEIAINAGAILVLSECEDKKQHGLLSWLDIKDTNKQVAVIAFYQLNHHLFSLAKAFYQQPQGKLTMVGVTGTNGKTSTSQLIASLLNSGGKSCGVIGTNGAGNIKQLEQLKPIRNTTPGATELSKLLAGFVEEKIEVVAMEVSSHALEQRRVTSDIFSIAVFTNLTRDHLDYHHTMEEYAAAKRKIFSNDESQIAIVNGDDKVAQQWLKNWSTQPVIVYGRDIDVIAHKHFVKASHIGHHGHGVSFLLTTHLGNINIDSVLMGDFNIDNLLAAISVLMVEKYTLEEIAKNINMLVPILGRMETFTAQGKSVAVVDYAHTPDALEKALLACRQHCKGVLWLVFGCGGDRDKGKRPLMGQIAEKYADKIVITNDNPRTENPQTIVNEIIAGCLATAKVSVNIDRKQAVLSTLSEAAADDIVLLAGKGHEDYLIIGNEHISYNERTIVNEFYHGEVAR